MKGTEKYELETRFEEALRGHLGYEPTDGQDKLAPEDIEAIMQSNVNNDPHFYDTPPEVGYDDETGYGRPNAGRILEKLQLPCYRVRHFEGSIRADENWSLDATDVPLFVQGTFSSALDQELPFLGNITADRYKVTHTLYHNVLGETVLEAWKRDAASNLAPNINELPSDGVSITLDSYDASSATLTGYIYKITDEDENVYWWPINPEDDAVFAYSIYTHDTQADPCLTVGMVDEDKTMFSIFPNPTMYHVIVEQNQPMNTFLTVYNSTGAEISHWILRESRSVIDVSTFPTGLYLFVIGENETRQTFKIVKQ